MFWWHAIKYPEASCHQKCNKGALVYIEDTCGTGEREKVKSRTRPESNPQTWRREEYVQNFLEK